jgi:hypothetical protein
VRVTHNTSADRMAIATLTHTIPNLAPGDGDVLTIEFDVRGPVTAGASPYPHINIATPHSTTGNPVTSPNGAWTHYRFTAELKPEAYGAPYEWYLSLGSNLLNLPNNKVHEGFVDNVVVTQVPEPASVGWFVLAAAGVALRRRRRIADVFERG